MQTITYIDDCFNKNRLTRWPDGVMPLKVYIGNFNWYKSAGKVDEYRYTQLLIDGFNTWEQLTGGLVAFERTMNLYDSNVNIDWKRVERKSLGSCTFNYDKSGRYYSAEVSIGLSDGIIHHQYMDDNEIFHTILHEIGHSVGLGHSKTKGDIMYVPHQYGVVNISKNDIETLRWLYRLPVGKTKEEILNLYKKGNLNGVDEMIKVLNHKEKKSNFEKTKDEILNSGDDSEFKKDLSQETQNIGDIKKYLLQVNSIDFKFKKK